MSAGARGYGMRACDGRVRCVGVPSTVAGGLESSVVKWEVFAWR